MLQIKYYCEKNNKKNKKNVKKFSTGLIDVDVLNVSYAQPVNRAARAFRAKAETEPLSPNARAVVTSPYQDDIRLYLGLGFAYSYTRSCTLSLYNLSGNVPHHAPLRNRNALHYTTNSILNEMFPIMDGKLSHDSVTATTPHMMAGLFGVSMQGQLE
jgi:hypothetical protein